MPLLDKHLVAHAGVLAVKILYAKPFYGRPDELVCLGIPYRGRRVPMVKNAYDLVRIPDLVHTSPEKDLAYGAHGIVDHCQIKICHHVLTRLYVLFP
ncbi:MAG: hypothetical protein A4E64_02485 [Syntrophorhabdus sp. PtaU1.Bin058]|nr:MAG: hypothetical protein A4E64_02485 [Syntrophorhabdus sp. PtaU1.Bin058]